MEDIEDSPTCSMKIQATKRKGPSFVSMVKNFILEADGKFKCKIEEFGRCAYSQENYDAGNFVRHFRNMHHDVAQRLGFSGGTPAKKKRSSEKLTIFFDRQKFYEACVKLVTKHNLPLCCFDWEALRLILDPLAEALNTTINRKNMKNHLQRISGSIIEGIKQEISERLISIKIDSASRFGRHILCINAQYELNHEVMTRTLCMIEVKESQTAKFLKIQILEVLKRFNISLDQIFSITSDNGANMIAAAKKLQEQFSTAVASDDWANEEDVIDNTEEIMDALSVELSDHFNIVRCASHTLQLALNDVVSNSDANIKIVTEFSKSNPGAT
ncbi:uncharacterized protein LOC115265845 [Aedes albopictus]|uniref:DUF4371 domain-containing protein n=1 Tax=Aedes albopictus TaxID=7160 RepID=A0ABM1Z3W8_AEDAL